jgi:hypothetical protein
MARSPSTTKTARKSRPANRDPQLINVAPVMPKPAAQRVDFMRQELVDMLPQYTKISDCIRGSEAVKAKQTVYLPKPNPEDTSRDNELRYEDYLQRAIFYNVAKRTLAGLVGAVFMVPPTIKVPALLDPVVKDANGTGVSLPALAQRAEGTVLARGRGGLFVDYPKTDTPVTRAAQQNGSIRPTINFYEPESIINWRTVTIGSEIKLSLVVLKEQYETYDDGFAIEYADQFRVLRLDYTTDPVTGLVTGSGQYRQEIWRGSAGAYAIVETSYPKDSKGVPLKEIPFTFIGSVDNSPSVDPAPMIDICELNIGHYVNSASYEESVYITGQATPVLSGLDQRWVDEVLKGEVRLGSRAAIPLPVGADAQLLQMEERTAAFAAMEHKERQMVALGAKLVEQKQVQRTATEAKGEEASETSVLDTVTKNVSAAFQWALEWAGIFQGVTSIARDAKTADDDKRAIIFELNNEFDLASVDYEDVKAAIEAWIKGTITWEEMRAVLRKARLATLDDAEAKAQIARDMMDMPGNENDGNGNNPPGE